MTRVNESKRRDTTSNASASRARSRACTSPANLPQADREKISLAGRRPRKNSSENLPPETPVERLVVERRGRRPRVDRAACRSAADQLLLERLAGMRDFERESGDEKEALRRQSILEVHTLAIDYALDGQAEALVREAWRVANDIYVPSDDCGVELNFGLNATAEQMSRIARRHYRADKDHAPAFLNAEEKRRLIAIIEDLRLFARKYREPGRNDFVMDCVVDALKPLRSAHLRASGIATTPSIARQWPVMLLALAWNHFTGEPCSVSRNRTSGTLFDTPVVKFVWAVLADLVPTLVEGEVEKGIRSADKLIKRYGNKAVLFLQSPDIEVDGSREPPPFMSVPN